MTDAKARNVRIFSLGGELLSKDELETMMRTESEELIGRVATEIWRLVRRLERVPDETRNELRSIGDSASRLSDALAQYDVLLQAHDGQIYDDGLTVDVLSSPQTDVQLVVAETIEPTVIWKGRMIRRGKVTLREADA